MRKALLIGFAVIFAQQAQAASPSLLPSKKTNNAPIEINADQLEVFQEENRAIFTGHVVAIQGDVRLKSEKMNVFYRKPAEDGSEKKAEDGDAIKKIEVTGNVFLSTPQETASGARGVYDVENRKINLYDHVVLTREKNTLKGDTLVYDFATGKSKLTGGASATQAGTKGKERVRALFVPDKKDAGKQP